MMSFGWRPNQSCYQAVGKQTAKAACPSACWWYALLALAVVGGVAVKK
jgi:hypothetical protein